MSPEENITLIQRLYEELNRGNLAGVQEFLAPDYVVHDLDNPRFLGDRQSHKEFLTRFYATFSGQTTIEDMTAAGDKVVVYKTFHGTSKAEWQGLPPGQQVTFPVIETYRIANGKIVEEWHQDRK